MTPRSISSWLPPPPRVSDNLLLTNGSVETDALGAQAVFLRPGDWIFARGAIRVATLLGSCVALAIWSPRHRLGAVCHCLLPDRPHVGGDDLGQDGWDGRYGCDAAKWLDKQFEEAGCAWSEVEVSLAGGASSHGVGIGPSNITWAQNWASERRVAFAQQDVGGRVVRRLTFNMADGALTVAHGGRMTGQRL